MDANSPRTWVVTRIAAILIVAVVAVVMVSMSWVVGLIAALTVAAVMLDLFAFSAHTPSAASASDADQDAPTRITVDLSRRR